MSKRNKVGNRLKKEIRMMSRDGLPTHKIMIKHTNKVGNTYTKYVKVDKAIQYLFGAVKHSLITGEPYMEKNTSINYTLAEVV